MTAAVRSDASGTYGALQLNGVDVVKFDSAGLQASSIPDTSITPTKLTQKSTLGTAVASTSGTAIDFTGIPDWAKRVTVMFNGVSTSGTSIPVLRLGTDAGVTVTGYVASAAQMAATTTFVDGTTYAPLTASWAATIELQGHCVMTKVLGDSWLISGVFATTTRGVVVSCRITLADTLTRIRLTTANGTDTFDAGTINIMWE